MCGGEDDRRVRRINFVLAQGLRGFVLLDNERQWGCSPVIRQ
jgi:hypothetical protein